MANAHPVDEAVRDAAAHWAAQVANDLSAESAFEEFAKYALHKLVFEYGIDEGSAALLLRIAIKGREHEFAAAMAVSDHPTHDVAEEVMALADDPSRWIQVAEAARTYESSWSEADREVLVAYFKKLRSEDRARHFLRFAAGASAEMLAEQAGVSESTMSKWFRRAQRRLAGLVAEREDAGTVPSAPNDSRICIEVTIPDGVDETEALEQIVNAALIADAMHREKGGSGLTVDGLKACSELRVPTGAPT